MGARDTEIVGDARELKTQRPRSGKTQSQRELSLSLRGTVTQRQQYIDIDRHSETRDGKENRREKRNEDDGERDRKIQRGRAMQR